MEQMSFVTACNRYFGRKEGQSVQEFAIELKALSPKDRADMSKYFEQVGIKINE